MHDKREFTRFELLEIQGKMTLASKVEIVDISLGGVCVKADKRIEVGRAYTIKIVSRKQCVDIRGIVMRSTIVGMRTGADGEGILTYAAGLKFLEGQDNKIAALLESADLHAKQGSAQLVERRNAVRFQITAPDECTMVFPVNFDVQEISLNSMRICADQPLRKDVTIPMALQLNDDNHLNFTGKVSSSRKVEKKGRAYHDIELTYADLTDTDRVMIKKFIDYLLSDSIRKRAAR